MSLFIILVLLLVGLLLLIVEAFVPGGIVSTIGILFILGSGFLFAREYGWTAGWIYFSISAILGFLFWLGGFLYLAKKMALHPPKAEPVSSSALIGSKGTVVQTLRPIGSVEIGGKKLAATSYVTNREIPPGTPIIVTGTDGSYLIVKPEGEE